MRVKLSYSGVESWLEFPDGQPLTVARVLQSVQGIEPGMFARWCDEEGELRKSLAVFVNREHIRYRQGLGTEIGDGDEVHVIPVISGG